MTETQRQIKELRKALPGLKEKVFGVALLLCLSLVMVASVSYAWVTMSTNPELGGVNTTVAANGALEIALSDFDGEEPEQSAAGDSFAAEGQSTHAANTSWGNLVNLSAGYGVDNLVLRPAKLDLTSPNYIYSVKYGQDGRVEGTFTDFGFTTWYQTDATTDTWRFVAPSNYPDTYPDGNAYGVRAISSVKYEGQEDINVQKLRDLDTKQKKVNSDYVSNIMENSNTETVIEKLVNQYLDHTIQLAIVRIVSTNEKLSSFKDSVTDPGPIEDMKLDGKTYIPGLWNLMKTFYEDSVLAYGETLVYAANLQSQSGTVYTLETLLAANRADLLADNIKLASLGYNSSTGKYDTKNHYKTLHDTAQTDYETMKALYNDGQYAAQFKWSDLETTIDHLIGINQLTLYIDENNKYTMTQVQNMGGSAALNLMQSLGDSVEIHVAAGNLKDFEQISGAEDEDGFTIRLKIEVTNVNGFLAQAAINSIFSGWEGDATITTTADHANAYAWKEKELTQIALNAVDNRDLVAADTYGMILDLWVRTNAEASMLTLNGTPKMEERQAPETITIAGHDAPRTMHTYSFYTDQRIEMAGVMVDDIRTYEVYEVYHDPDGEGGLPEDYYYYYVSDHLMAYEKKVVSQDGQTSVVDTETPLSQNSKNKNGIPMLTPKTTPVYDVVGFETANRIWQENDTDKPIPGVGEISTTQGSGSCYIFRADNDEEYQNTKRLLENMRLVFLDENGNELSKARLDTKHIFAENGKYTVPLCLDSYKESIVIVQTDEEGNELTDEEGNVLTTTIPGLCRLEKNVARRISVLVYLEGEGLTNEMVMSAESVIGSLNLQFDSTADLHSVGDTDLETEMISLEATIDQTTLAYTGETQYVELSAIIDGLVPQKVEAAFARMYSATQGTMGTFVELQQGADGYWKADMPFYSPGRYVLEALKINGVEYKLSEPLEVNMSGFDVSAATFDTHAVLTVDKRITRTVAVQLASAVMPKRVVAQFVSVDKDNNKSFVNVNLNRAGDLWSGEAVFTKSGQYTLTYLIMDGEPYELPAALQKSFMAYLGLTADVTLERYIKDENGNDMIGSLDYAFEGTETLNAFVQIYDDAGVPMDTLGEITMYYKPFGAVHVENGFISQLKWNGEEYAGVLPARSPGRYVFGELRLGDEKITAARSAPELWIRSKEPPKASLLDAAITYEGGTAYFNISIENAATANSWVVLDNGSQEYTLPLTAYGSAYRTAIPSQDGNSNGVWTATKVLFDNVYINEDFYPAGGDKYVININKSNSYTVVNYLIVETGSITLDGRTEKDGEGGFMQGQSLKEAGLFATVKAPDMYDSNKFIPANQYNLSSVTVSLSHKANTTKEYGGYTASSNMPSPSTSVTLTPSTVGKDSITFTYDSNVQLYVAGEYTIKATAVIGGMEFHSQSDAVAKVYTKPVSVAIDSAKSGYSVSNADSTKITVSSESYTSGCDTLYRAPYVAINLVGRTDTSYTAELNFDATEKSKISASENTGNGVGYSWSTSDATITRWLGTLASDKKSHTKAGTLTADKLILTKGDVTYSFDVSITINN